MHPSRHIIVPFFTILHWSVTAVHAALTSGVPAVAAAHSRDFHAVKRQIRNADYAGGTLPNSMTTSDPAAHSHPTTTPTNAPPASHPSDSIKGGPKDPRSLGLQPQHNTSISDLQTSSRPHSSDELIRTMPEKRDTDTWKGSPRTSDYSGSRSRRQALADASRKLPAYPGKATSHVRRVEKKQGPTYEVATKSQAGRHASDIVARAQEAARRSTAGSLPTVPLHGLPLSDLGLREPHGHTSLEGETLVVPHATR